MHAQDYFYTVVVIEAEVQMKIENTREFDEVLSTHCLQTLELYTPKHYELHKYTALAPTPTHSTISASIMGGGGEGDREALTRSSRRGSKVGASSFWYLSK